MLFLSSLDTYISQFLYENRSEPLASLLYSIALVASQTTAWVLFILFAAYLHFRKELTYLYALAVTFIGSEATVYLLKTLLNRERPDGGIAYYALETGRSFPSGHAAVAASLIGFIVYYLYRRAATVAARQAILFSGILLIALITFSRVYLGAHHLTDVLGGLLIGGFWLMAGIALRERLASREKASPASLNKPAF